MSKTIRKAIHDHLHIQHQTGKPCRHWLAAVAMMPALAVFPLTGANAQQQAQEASSTLDEIIVTARRRDESLQDVPVTVNVVTADMLTEQNIIRFEDIQNLVAGLELEERSVGPIASLRGVRFDAFASGNNSSVEFYLNDAAVTSVVAMQSLFDIGQIEVLRGPQGTLRGRSSPSGSITMTTRRPDLDRFGGEIDLSATDEGSESIRGALNIPVVEDMLAVRLAGFRDENRQNHAKSFRTGKRAKQENEGWRASIRYEPIDTLSFNFMHQDLSSDIWSFDTVESAHLRDPGVAESPVPIRARDRLSSAWLPGLSFAEQKRTGLEVGWEIGPVMINYAGSLTKGDLSTRMSGDAAGYYGPTYPDSLHYVGQWVDGWTDAENHELRFSGNFTERLSYVFGAMTQEFESANDITTFTPIFIGGTAPANLFQIVVTPVLSYNESEENSIFGNLTYKLTDNTEVSAGLRYIDYEVQQGILFGGAGGSFMGGIDDDWSTTVYNVSISHNLTSDLMVYATAGSSWRPGNVRVGNSNTVRSEREQSFLFTPPEESDSIEFGFKSTWLDQRLRINGTIFYQKFDNYPYLGDAVPFVNTDSQGIEQVSAFGFTTPVDLDTFGLEVDASFQITERWNINGTYSWAQGTQKGVIACNDYFPTDGKPDTSSGNPPLTVEQIRAATGGDNLAACNVSMRSYDGPTWSTSLRSEYWHPLLDSVEGYVRLQANIYGDSKGSPTNPRDQVSSHGIFSLYAGLRSPDRKWDVMVYVKNLTDKQILTDWGGSEMNTTLRVIPPNANVSFPSGYRTVSYSNPREMGINLRYSF